jgi:hypothetical protein
MKFIQNFRCTHPNDNLIAVLTVERATNARVTSAMLLSARRSDDGWNSDTWCLIEYISILHNSTIYNYICSRLRTKPTGTAYRYYQQQMKSFPTEYYYTSTEFCHLIGACMYSCAIRARRTNHQALTPNCEEQTYSLIEAFIPDEIPIGLITMLMLMFTVSSFKLI